ncbi:venom metalloproteinase antarease-like TtrivMP_A isoform X2 [Ornithodoros turicata]|uniref:venom metalloproteinase antarease-like TtrivMP_A isoform X2 n=1 Tax=Ornithodoros turicata TaxID=34597 RepID=UPI0031398553
MRFTLISVFATVRLLSQCACTCTGKEPPTVFYPVLLAGRSVDGAKSVYIDDQLTLNLEKTSILSKPFTVRIHEGKVPRDSVVDIRDIEDNLYHDPNKLSAVIMRERDTGIEMEGIINKSHRIQPSITSARSADGQLAHEMHCTEEGGHDYDKDTATELRPEWRSLPIKAREESQLQFPSAIYPSMYVVSDYHHSGNVTLVQLLRYIAIFYASVNLRLKDLYDPAVHFNIRGITKLQERQTDILSETVRDGQTYMHNEETLVRFRYHYITKSTEDIAVLMTGLGAPHDGENNARSCKFSDGYIMGYNNKSVNHYTFSVCSQDTIRAHLKSANKPCVAAMATPGYNAPKGLPGKNINLDKYCNMVDKKMTFGRLTVGEGSRCNMRCCRTILNGTVWDCFITSALDGSTCDAAKGHVCINGICGKEEDLVKPKRHGGA